MFNVNNLTVKDFIIHKYYELYSPVFNVNKLTVKDFMIMVKDFMINKYYEIYSPVFNINKLMIKKIIIMCIHHVPINTLSAHMTHINLNIIFYTHAEHSPSKTAHTNHHTERHR